MRVSCHRNRIYKIPHTIVGYLHEQLQELSLHPGPPQDHPQIQKSLQAESFQGTWNPYPKPLPTSRPRELSSFRPPIPGSAAWLHQPPPNTSYTVHFRCGSEALLSLRSPPASNAECCEKTGGDVPFLHGREAKQVGRKLDWDYVGGTADDDRRRWKPVDPYEPLFFHDGRWPRGTRTAKFFLAARPWGGNNLLFSKLDPVIGDGRWLRGLFWCLNKMYYLKIHHNHLTWLCLGSTRC